MSHDLLARSAGLCPICTNYIAKNRSHITALVVPFPCNPRYVEWHVEKRSFLVSGTFVKRMTARRWAHVKCLQKLNDKYSVPEQIGLAGDWHDELVEIRTRGEAQR